MFKKIALSAIFSLFLTACGSNPNSYIKPQSKPIVNVEAQVNDLVKIEAESENLTLTNQTEQHLNLLYKLYWYDKNGVTQSFNPSDKQAWQNLWFLPKQHLTVPLIKPTEESQNYRVYVRGGR